MGADAGLRTRTSFDFVGNVCHQCREVHRLGEMPVATGFQRPLHVLGIGETGDGEDDKLIEFRPRADLPGKVIARDFGHGDVEQEDVGLERFEPGKALHAAEQDVDFVARSLEQVAQHFGGIGMVVDDQNAASGPPGAGRLGVMASLLGKS